MEEGNDEPSSWLLNPEFEDGSICQESQDVRCL
jgi:hypothetical protein